MTKSQSIARGAFYIVAAELSFAVSAAIIKLVSVSLPNESIVFFRNFFGLLILAPWLISAGKNILHTDKIHLHLMRTGFGMAAMYTFFYGLAHIPLGNSLVIKSTIPLIIPFISFLWLKESLSKQVAIAGCLGFLGVLLILKPDGNTDWASLVALGSSCMAASAFVTIRKLGETEPTLRIVAYFAIFGISISAIPLFWVWQTPTIAEYLMLFALGLTATVGQLLLTLGYQNAPASRVGIFTYASIPFGTSIGWILWGDLLDLNSLIGAGLIILAGLNILRGGKSYSKN